jgi:CubicO group peptidase (beta-lactamase class C family)
VRDIMAHRAGLSRLQDFPQADLFDAHTMEARFAAAPVDHLVGRSAYHALTYGWLISGLARAITGNGMRELFRTEIADPLGTDGVHLGRPSAGARTTLAQTLLPQSATLSSAVDAIAPRLTGLPLSGTLSSLYFPGMISVLQGDMAFLDAEIPSANGVFTARSLAKVYGAIANRGHMNGHQYLSTSRVRALTARRSLRPDGNVGVPLSFHLGYHGVAIPKLLPGFGHSGLGGSVGWANPADGSAFGFVHNRLITPMIFDQSAFVVLAVLLRRALGRIRSDAGRVIGG